VKGVKAFEIVVDSKWTGLQLIAFVQEQVKVEVNLVHLGKTVEAARTLEDQEI
jgi:hypothetical protein